MDLIKLKIPASFIMAHACMSWPELKYGLTNELLDEQAVIDFALDQVSRQEHPADALLQLAWSSGSDPILGLVEQLAADEPERTDAVLRDKWLYLVLAWLYERREAMTAPLEVVEEVYADFGYPEEIASFVRYMPMEGPDLGSREANEQRLMARWRQYLESRAAKHKKGPGNASPTQSP